MTTVTRLTADSDSADTLGDQEYRDIYLELAQGRSTRQVEAMLGDYSNAWWSEFGKGNKPVTSRARAALRRAVGIPELPPTAAELLAGVDPGAEVYRVGNLADLIAGGHAPDRVILAQRGDSASLRLTDTDVLLQPANSALPVVTPLTPPSGVGEKRSPKRKRGVGTTPATVDQNVRRQALGATWKEIYDAGLAALEEQKGT